MDTTILKSLASLVELWESKNGYICGHSAKVAQMASDIAREFALDPLLINKVRFAGLVHDIGNIGIREEILNKPAGLTVTEYQIIKSHCDIGVRLLRSFTSDDEVLGMVQCHHERYDGSGYPNGLAGEQIPRGARILAVADAYDAMTSDRPYRRKMSVADAHARLEKGRGAQFDPVVVNAFRKISAI